MRSIDWEDDPHLKAAARSARLPVDGCPGDAEIFAYVSGAAGEGAEALREHLARCRRCSAVARDALAFAAAWRPAEATRRLWLQPRRLAWAAAALVLLAGAPLVRRTWRPVPPDPLADDLPLQAAPFAAVSSGDRWRGTETAGDAASSLAAAMEPYGRADYRSAVAALDRHLRRWPDDGVARFYSGVALLLAGRAAEAVARLEPLAEGEAALARGEVEWYLALAYLRDGQPDKAVAALGTVEAVSLGRRDAALSLRRRILAER